MAVSLTTIGLSGCSKNWFYKVNPDGRILKNLEKVYDEDFNITYMTSDILGNEFRAGVQSINNPEIRFDVVMYSEDDSVYTVGDNYYDRMVMLEFNKVLKEKLEEHGLDTESYSTGYKEVDDVNYKVHAPNKDTTIEEYIELLNDKCVFHSDIAVNGANKELDEVLTKIISAMEDIKKVYPTIDLYGGFYLYNSESDYVNAKDYINKTTNPSPSTLKGFGATHFIRNGILDNKVRYDVENTKLFMDVLGYDGE